MFTLIVIGLRPTKTCAELDSSTVLIFEKNYFTSIMYHPLSSHNHWKTNERYQNPIIFFAISIIKWGSIQGIHKVVKRDYTNKEWKWFGHSSGNWQNFAFVRMKFHFITQRVRPIMEIFNVHLESNCIWPNYNRAPDFSVICIQWQLCPRRTAVRLPAPPPPIKLFLE